MPNSFNNNNNDDNNNYNNNVDINTKNSKKEKNINDLMYGKTATLPRSDIIINNNFKNMDCLC